MSLRLGTDSPEARSELRVGLRDHLAGVGSAGIPGTPLSVNTQGGIGVSTPVGGLAFAPAGLMAGRVTISTPPVTADNFSLTSGLEVTVRPNQRPPETQAVSVKQLTPTPVLAPAFGFNWEVHDWRDMQTGELPTVSDIGEWAQENPVLAVVVGGALLIGGGYLIVKYGIPAALAHFGRRALTPSPV